MLWGVAGAINPLFPVDLLELCFLIFKEEEIPHVYENIVGLDRLVLVTQQINACKLLHNFAAYQTFYVSQKLKAFVVGHNRVCVIWVLMLDAWV